MADIYSDSNLIIHSLTVVYDNLKKYSFHVVRDVQFDVAMKRVKAFFSFNDSEAAAFTYVFVTYYDYNLKPVTFGMMSDSAGCNPLRLFEFSEEFKTLEERCLIYKEKAEEGTSQAIFYRIPEGVLNAVIKNDEKLLVSGCRIKDVELTYPEDIAHKDLFYMDSIKEDIRKLADYLDKDNLSSIQERLQQKSMPKGVCIILHGAPGTGKTETVYQLAKQTGRSIYHIDIGSTISCWHGGTEKNIASIFEKYSRLCRQAKSRGEEIPILLFNEADALFGRRLENPRQGSEIDENHIQSVLLDYMERQEGVLIATTNLVGTFDEAFERRFLFKVKFENPDFDIKKKIWKNKVQWLNKQTVDHLASAYSFSGGEIDNVVRKATMNEVLTGKRPSVSELEKFCEKEKLEKKHSARIGFNN